jgi:hypothetical protein
MPLDRVQTSTTANFQNPANAKQPRRADAVLPSFIFLNLLLRDAQGLRELRLAHFEYVPTLAHSSTNISINGGCTPRCDLLCLRFFHIGTLLSSPISRQLPFSPTRVFAIGI